MAYSFICQRPSDALALGRSNLPSRILVCEGGPAAASVATHLGADMISIEDVGFGRRAWSNSDIAAVLDYTRAEAGSNRLLAYAASRDLKSAAAKAGFALKAPRGDLKDQLDEKDVARAIFQRLGLPTVPWVSGPARFLRFEDLAREFGERLVVQRLDGSAGRGTHVVRTSDEMKSALAEAFDMPHLVSPFIDGPVLNLHGIVLGSRVEASLPSMQITGAPSLTRLPLGYCGNDFAAAAQLPRAILSQARELVRSLGRELGRLGWRGIFGIDVIVHQARVLALEINPRFQGSSWLLSDVEEANGGVPMGAWHRDHYLESSSVGPDAFSETRAAVAQGGFVILHSNRAQSRRIVYPPPGVYDYARGELRYRRSDLGLLACSSDEIYLEGFPISGSSIEAGAVLARAASWRQLIETDGRMTSWACGLIEALEGLLGESRDQPRPPKQMR